MTGLEYLITETDGITIIAFLRPPDIELFTTAAADFRANYPNKRRLWDLSSGLNLSPHNLRRIGETARSVDADIEKVAIVVNTQSDYGLIRMFSVHRTRVQMSLEIFHDRTKALDWIKESRNA
jgi:hypothetical protein